jgi:ribulose bisphosphate carboxylase small subunit
MMQRIRRYASRIAPVFGLLLVSPAVLEAHAIHTTLTVLTASPTGFTINIRTFADDFSASVAHFAGRKAPADSSAPELDVARYVRAQFAVRDAAGHMVTLESCGTRRAAELYWLCFKATLPAGIAGTVIRNQLLTEYHADQVNIVQVDDRGARRTLLFTKASAPSPITSGP